MKGGVELLAPAGSWESLSAAVEAGADSLFFGCGTLNMRSASTANFGEEDLPAIMSRLREAKMRGYLTLNTTLFDGELESAQRLISAAVEAGVDALIASDAAVVGMARAAGLPVHISTQQSVSNYASLAHYAQWADAVVLARELSLEQIGAITQRVAAERLRGPSGELVRIEVFAHGAICMARSGQCLLSLHATGRSANRGACLQLCRRRYRLEDLETGFEIGVDGDQLLSPRDLCTVGILDRVVGSGASILKLEGRARSAEYVYVVTRVYREALDALAAGEYSSERVEGWKARLGTVFNRGFFEGYMLGTPTSMWSSGGNGSQATERKRQVGVVTNFFAQAGVAEVRIDNWGLKSGHALWILGPTTGALRVEACAPWVEGVAVARVSRGETCSLRVGGRVRRGDRVFEVE